MPRKARLSIDQGIKELLQLRPMDAFAFLLPDVHADRGDPSNWEFLSTQVRKKDLWGKGYLMDLNIRYEFAHGEPVLLMLVEVGGALSSSKGRLTSAEEESIMSYLATMPKPRLLVKIEKLAAKEGLRKGLEQGIRSSKLEDARRMLARGCDWAFITDITGLRPEDLDVPASA